MKNIKLILLTVVIFVILLVLCYFSILNYYSALYKHSKTSTNFKHLQMITSFLEKKVTLEKQDISVYYDKMIPELETFNYSLIILNNESITYQQHFRQDLQESILQRIISEVINDSALQGASFSDNTYAVFFKKSIISDDIYYVVLIEKVSSALSSIARKSFIQSIVLSLLLTIIGVILFIYSHLLHRKGLSLGNKEDAEIYVSLSTHSHSSPYVITNRQGQISKFNTPASNLFAKEDNYLSNKNFFELIIFEDKNQKIYDVESVDKQQFTLNNTRGENVFVELFVEKLQIGKRKIKYIIFINNITEQLRINEVVHKEIAKFRAIMKFSEMLSSITDPKLITKYVIDDTKNLVDYKYGTLLVFDNGHLTVFYTNDPEIQSVKSSIKLKIGEGLSGLVAETRQGIYLNNTTSNSVTKTIEGTPDIVEKLLSVPLISKTKLLGVMTITRQEEVDFTDEDLHIMEIFASQVATVMDNANLLQRLTNSEKTYRSLINEARVGIFILQANKITFVNDSFCKMLDMSKDFLVGSSMLDIIEPSEQGKFASKMSNFLLNSEYEVQQLKLIKSDHGIVTVELMFSMAHWENKLAIMGMVTDITEKISLYNQLNQTQKMESVGSMAGGIAHDFKNILSGILGATEMLLINSKPESKIHNYATMIKKSADRGSALAHRILKFSRKDDKTVKLFDLNEVIHEVLELVSHTFPKNIAFTTDLSDTALVFEGDPVKFQQIILNITVNARDAMPNGGLLTIRSQKMVDFSEETVDESFFAKISITDTGTGMTEEVKQHIFEPFFTTKGAEKGTGLGMSTTIRIIQEFNGKLDLESEVNKGSKFIISLPLSKKTLTKEVQIVTTPSKFNPHKILLVDDEEIVLEIAKELLEEIGNSVIAVDSGEKALQVLEENPDIDIAILDRILPTISGIDLFRQLKAKYPQLNIIISSGLTEDKSIQELKKEGLLGYITKPFRLEDICNVINRIE
ncbi:MAG: response regulator [Candidatus Cloacimonetes bacterium]|nr:response regulator [Candidatus Cloacimonadota bacterium]